MERQDAVAENIFPGAGEAPAGAKAPASGPGNQVSYLHPSSGDGWVTVGRSRFKRLNPMKLDDMLADQNMSKHYEYIQRHMPGDADKWMNIVAAESGGRWNAEGDKNVGGSIGPLQINRKYNPQEYEQAQEALRTGDYDSYYAAAARIARRSKKNPYSPWTTAHQLSYN